MYLGDAPIRLRRTAKGAVPLWTPLFQHPARAFLGGHQRYWSACRDRSDSTWLTAAMPRQVGAEAAYARLAARGWAAR